MLIIKYLLTICGLESCVGKPEKVRTGLCFLERKMALRKWRKTDPVVFSGLFFFGSFLLEEQKKGTYIKKKKVPFETPSFCFMYTKTV